MNGLRNRARGQVLPLFCAGMVVIIAMCGLALDVGMLYSARRNMQTAADAAAIAAGTALRTGGDISDAANKAAKLNGFTGGSDGSSCSTSNTCVTVNNPPTGTYADGAAYNANYVEVVVSQPQPTFFLRVLDLLGCTNCDTIPVGARAVSGVISGPACIYSLDPTDSKTFEVSGGSSKVEMSCGLLVRSTNNDGLDASGGSIVSTGSIGIVADGSPAYGDSGGSSVSPTPVSGIPPFGDPLASLAPPSPCSSTGGCTATCNSLTTSGGHGYVVNSTPASAISPGVYCGGITVNSPATLTLNQGTYILLGGGLTVQGGGNIVSNTGGVTFYNTYNASNSYNTVNITGGSTTNLTAPSSGALQGILFFQDRTAGTPNPQNQKNVISGGSGTVFAGALYFPTQALTFTGGSAGTPEDAILVAYTITISGGTYLTSNYAPLGGISAIKSSSLYE
jgi:hypothetical protein